MDTRRTEAFSDGVFAVAITVLVFGLLPIGGGADVTHELLRSWPRYIAYVVSFLTIGIMWLNHHALIAQLREVNRPLLIMNLLLLMGVVAVPWPTTLVADHLTGPAIGGGRASTVTYGLVLLWIATAYSIMWVYIGRRAAQVAHLADRPPERLKTLRFMAGLGGYAIAAIVSFFSPGVAMTIYGLIAVYYFFEHVPSPASREKVAGGDVVPDLPAAEPGVVSEP
ncbi:MAG TPA: TMEM175 family protein [Streptosporangiaceae bacterium]|nr:TMEM175 family protein [Streptosporangiaceae bacterium]